MWVVSVVTMQLIPRFMEDEAGANSGSLVGPVDDATREKVKKSVAEHIVPLVKADGGEVFLVALTSDDVHLHLSGTCAGCPGAAMTQKSLINPVVSSVLPKAAVKVTTGWRVPKGAEKIE
jgi:Fe-S cluster biogenesis protein NfuA